VDLGVKTTGRYGAAMTEGPPPATVEGFAADWQHRVELFSIDRRSAYLNHGSFGAVPLPVQRAQQRLRDEMEANPMAFFTRGLIERIRHARTHLAVFVHADPDGVALVPNATAAATAVLRSIPLGPGQEVVLTDHGYGAVRLAAEEVAAHAGATVRLVTIPLTGDDDEIVERVVDGVSPGRSRLAVIDHIASPTAKIFPVDRLVTALRARDVPVLVDAAHAPGMLAVDVAATNADFWLGNLHKWAFAPRPSALLAVAPEHRAAMRPLVVSWEQPRGYPMAQEWAGTLDYTSWLAAPTGVHLLRTLGLASVRSHNVDLAAQGQRLVADAVATRWPGPAASAPLLDLARHGLLGSRAVSMRLVPLPPAVADDRDGAVALQARLASEHRIEVAVSVWGGTGYLRLSAQIYNQLEDFDRLAHALRAVLPG
jgi:isopenicillin-N epimerase